MVRGSVSLVTATAAGKRRRSLEGVVIAIAKRTLEAGRRKGRQVGRAHELAVAHPVDGLRAPRGDGGLVRDRGMSRCRRVIERRLQIRPLRGARHEAASHRAPFCSTQGHLILRPLRSGGIGARRNLLYGICVQVERSMRGTTFLRLSSRILLSLRQA